jgi:hypothetical protein
MKLRVNLKSGFRKYIHKPAARLHTWGPVIKLVRVMMEPRRQYILSPLEDYPTTNQATPGPTNDEEKSRRGSGAAAVISGFASRRNRNISNSSRAIKLNKRFGGGRAKFNIYLATPHEEHIANR